MLRVAEYRKIGQVVECFEASRMAELSHRFSPAKDIGYLDIEEMGRVERLAGCEDSLLNVRSRDTANEDLQYG